MSAIAAIAKHGVDVPLPPPLARRTCGVYLLIAESPRGEQVIYVGATNNIEERLRSHLYGVKGRLTSKLFHRAIWIELAPEDIGAYQGALVRALRPLHNTRFRKTCGRDLEILERLGLPAHDEDAVQEQLRTARARRSKRARS